MNSAIDSWGARPPCLTRDLEGPKIAAVQTSTRLMDQEPCGSSPRTLFDKIWQQHVVAERDGGHTLLYVDRHLIHEGTMGPFATLSERGLRVRRPDRTFGTADHFVPSLPGRSVESVSDPERRTMIESIEHTAVNHGIRVFRLGDVRQGIVHVVGPEQGLSLPGSLIVCGDSHTSTHGALGALAFGIGSTEVAHVLATQAIWQLRPKAMRVRIGGELQDGVMAKDLILAIIARIGVHGGTGHVIEYAGPAIDKLSMEGRMTVCNMSIEAGARAGLVAPDAKTLDYLQGRPFAPTGKAWSQASTEWRSLRTDDGAVFDREVSLDASSVLPMATWGTTPEQAAPINGHVPDLGQASDTAQRASWEAAMQYMDLKPRMPLNSIKIDHVFIGSCTNGRIEDLRAAADVVKGRRARIPAWVVPGSGQVSRQAQAEGLRRIFEDAGFEWREPGCSMCVGMNGDTLKPGQRCASTSNRNFMGRQGKGVRTHLLSPAIAAAAAVKGHLTDARDLRQGGT